MFELWTAVLWLILLLIPVTLLKRWVKIQLNRLGLTLLGTNNEEQNVQRMGWLTFLVLGPGVFLHELSHWLTAKLLLVRTGAFHLGPKVIKKNGAPIGWTLGYVEVGPYDPFRGSLIGVAPFVFGTLSILALAAIGFGQAIGPLLPPTTRIAQVFTRLPDLLGVADVWFWLYLVFSVSNSLIPSESDRREWKPALLYLILAFGFLVGLRGIPQASGEFITLIQRGLDALLFVFSLTLAVDLIVGMTIYVLYFVVSFFNRPRLYSG